MIGRGLPGRVKPRLGLGLGRKLLPMTRHMDVIYRSGRSTGSRPGTAGRRYCCWRTRRESADANAAHSIQMSHGRQRCRRSITCVSVCLSANISPEILWSCLSSMCRGSPIFYHLSSIYIHNTTPPYSVGLVIIVPFTFPMRRHRIDVYLS